MTKIPQNKNKSKQIVSGYPLLVIPEVASKIGLNESILIQQIHYWLLTAGKEINGKKWIYNSYAAWQKQFPFWSISTIRRTAKNLEKHNLIETDNFNHNSIDRTTWYTVNYAEFERLFKMNNGQFKMNNGEVKMNNAFVQNEPTIPETTTETTTETIDKKNAGKKKPAPQNYLYQSFLNAYCQWLNSKGLAPAINGREGKALKAIIAYFKKNCGGDEKKALQEFEKMLAQWEKLSRWHRDRLKLSQMENELVNILNEINNGEKQFGASNKKESTIERARRLAHADKNP